MPRDRWEQLRKYTSARIALGRSGSSLPTEAWLQFQLDHARAQDAVHARVDWEPIRAELEKLGLTTVTVRSQATDRMTHLRRPDLGRSLHEDDRARLQSLASPDGVDLVIVISDGLTAEGVHRYAVPLIQQLLDFLRRENWSLAPVVLASQSRVKLQDEIGQALRATIALTLIGERPGLAAYDSLGAYLVHSPGPGKSDADRNCVSNIREQGLPVQVAAQTLQYLLSESRRRKLTGTALKDDRGVVPRG